METIKYNIAKLMRMFKTQPIYQLIYNEWNGKYTLHSYRYNEKDNRKSLFYCPQIESIVMRVNDDFNDYYDEYYFNLNDYNETWGFEKNKLIKDNEIIEKMQKEIEELKEEIKKLKNR